jgi:autotransporter-associated beta strand protein
LTNLEARAQLPLPGEKSAEWSSRDRASTYNSISGQYVNWNANNDGSGNIGTQADGGVIMAQMNGPGCIWWMWSAQTGTGHVKIFLDGSNTPAVDLAFQDYFNRTQPPFNYPSLTYTVCGGFDSYLPIPYNVSCKVVAYGPWGQYFQFHYSTFTPGVTVPTFTTNLTVAEQTALSNVNNFFLNQLGSDPAGVRGGQLTVTNTYSIAPGQSVTNLNLAGQGAITAFKARLDNVAGISAPWKALRELTVSMFWDGETNPAVWAPLGDFFGSSCGYIPYRSLPLGMQSNGWMYCYWYMPFASGAQLVLSNDGSITRKVEVSVAYAPLTKPISSLARFHAKWNRGSYVTNNGRSPDYRFLSATGQGRLVGFALHVYQKVDVSPGPWWGEGDEKLFVDGEVMPSWFGTGSEDYFGFAWGTPGYFSQPFHSQLLAPPGNLYAPGNRALNRFHITDDVPFQSSFDGCIEKWSFTNENITSYAAMPYWYLASGGTDSYGPLSLDVRTNYYVPDYGFAWQNPNGGLWSSVTNWQNFAIANGDGLGVDFSGVDLAADTTVHLDSPHTLGSLIFGDADPSTPGSWILDNNGNALNRLTISGITSAITVGPMGQGASAIINAGINCASNLTKAGDGTLTLGSSNSLAGLIVNGGTNVITGNIAITGSGSSYFYLGNANTAYSGTLIIQNGATLNATGSFPDSFVVGRDGGRGTLIQNGGTFNFNPANQNYLFIGAANNPATQAEFDMNEGLLDMNDHILGIGLGAGVVITGRVNQVGGVITNVGTLNVGALFGTGCGVYTLSGGCIYIGSGGITTSSGSYQINLSGGTVGAEVSWSSSLNVTLTGSNGPVTFRPAGNTITLSGILSGPGGLTVTGGGTLEMSGANTYTGDTTVNSGSTLRLDSMASTSRTFRIVNGAVLNLNYIGARTVDNLYTNGSALPNGAYNAGNLPGFIIGTGSILVTGAIPRTPTKIKLSVSAGNLFTSWPPNYQGWVLQQQTNVLNTSLGTNWVDLAGTDSVTSTNIPINPATPMVFYRLRYPTP